MWSLTSLRTKRIRSFGKFRLLPPKDFFDSIGHEPKYSRPANHVSFGFERRPGSGPCLSSQPLPLHVEKPGQSGRVRAEAVPRRSELPHAILAVRAGALRLQLSHRDDGI